MQKWWSLFFVLLVALLIRLIGTIPGHNYYHPDEPMSYDSAMTMIMHGDTNPMRFDYPAGVPLLHTVIFQNVILPPVMFMFVVQQPGAIVTHIVDGPQIFWEKYSYQIFGKGELRALFWSRVITAILGFFAVALVYMIGRELISSTVGLLGAAFLAANYRHILSSHLALSDIPNSLFALVSFYTVTLLVQKSSRWRYVAAAIAIGLSLSMKYQIYPLISFAFVHTWWAIKKHSWKEFINSKLLLAISLITFVFVVINPYLLFNLGKAVAAIHMVSARYQAGIWHFNAYPLFFLYYWGIGIIPSILMIAGFLIGILIFPFQTIFLLTYIGPFLFTFLYYLSGGTYVRNFTTVIPFLCLFAGVFVYSLSEWIRKFTWISMPQIFLVLVVFLLSLGPLKDSIALDIAYTQPWARERLAEWVMKNVPDNSDIVNDNTAVPSNLAKPLNLTPWSRDIGNSITTLMMQNRDFAALNVNYNQAYFFFPFFNWSFTRLFSYGGLPTSFFHETYHGLLLEEYFHYTVHEVYKSYQAPDDAYLMIKIPKVPESPGREIRTFQFAEGLEGWSFLDFRKETHPDTRWNSTVGYQGVGSLEVVGNRTDVNLTRVVSPFIPITPGNVYSLTAYAKTDEVRDSIQKDGFFRLDFYSDAKNKSLRSGGLMVAVSDALFGPNAWSKQEVIATAPQGARFLTISFQRSNPEVSSHYWIDDIELFESNIPLKDKFPAIPYIKPTMPETIIYPNSIY